MWDLIPGLQDCPGPKAGAKPLSHPGIPISLAFKALLLAPNSYFIYCHCWLFVFPSHPFRTQRYPQLVVKTLLLTDTQIHTCMHMHTYKHRLLFHDSVILLTVSSAWKDFLPSLPGHFLLILQDSILRWLSPLEDFCESPEAELGSCFFTSIHLMNQDIFHFWVCLP